MSVWLSYESAVGRIARFWGGDGSVTGEEGEMAGGRHYRMVVGGLQRAVRGCCIRRREGDGHDFGKRRPRK